MTPPALKYPEFRSYISGNFVSNVGNSAQTWAIAWHVYQLTESSLMVGMLGLVRIVPLLILTLFGGVLADHADRRKLLLGTQFGMAFVALLILWLSYSQRVTVGVLYVLVALNAVARSFDGPARQSFVVGLVPLEHFPNAASINGVAWRLSDVLGPIVAGAFIASGKHGLTACYLFNSLTFIAVLITLWRLPARPPESTEGRPGSFKDVIDSIKEGLRFVNRTPVVRHAMWIDFWATLLSGAEALIPAFAVILGLGAQGYGILAASTGAGALIAAAALSFLPTIHNQGRWVVTMIAAFGLFTICFGLSNSLITASLSLAAVGAADMISTVMRQTIRQLATPDAMRGRMSATSSLFHISGPQLGDFEAGAVAGLWGERVSIVLGGALCLGVAVLWSRAKELVSYQHERAD